MAYGCEMFSRTRSNEWPTSLIRRRLGGVDRCREAQRSLVLCQFIHAFIWRVRYKQREDYFRFYDMGSADETVAATDARSGKRRQSKFPPLRYCGRQRAF